jgi:D-alanyl-D-alanine carboxypeptidase (penicillin-binding protein 5/6)
VKTKLGFWLLTVFLGFFSFRMVYAQDEDLISSPHGILMEASTGEIIYQKGEDERVSPASITKIMTLLLTFEELEKGNIALDDLVTTSAYAKSMGGSQVFLEEGEQQTVETLIKCIVIASGNDASVAMAEYIGGSEGEFVNRMNRKAQQLGMENTHFEDCCGLTESSNHYTTARDVAIMSRELITRYPKILDYSSIWMEEITHVTKQGESAFMLTNTNKLLRNYQGCLGLKTGSTSLAKYCVSNVAVRDEITLISVVMTAPDYKTRFRDSAAMLNYGFEKCSLYTDDNTDELPKVSVTGSITRSVTCAYKEEFRYLNTTGNPLGEVKKEIRLPEKVKAPMNQGDKAGEALYTCEGKELGTVDLIYTQTVEAATWTDCLQYLWKRLWFA